MEMELGMELGMEMDLGMQKTTKFLFYMLEIKPNFPNANNIIGKIKYEINLEELSKSPLCYHNDNAYEYMSKPIDKGGHGWGNNYTSETSRNIFDCHAIDYIIENCEWGVGKQISIHILFFSLKKEELLIPSVIKNDNSIKNIINRHIMYYNNLTNIDYHNYQINLLCKELSNNRFLDLRYQPLIYCKTKLYDYQKDNIQWMINIENNPPLINFSGHKIFDLGSDVKLYFDYDMSCNEDCFIPYDKFPKRKVNGGIICDETGLGKTIQLLNLVFSTFSTFSALSEYIKTLIIVPNHIKQHWANEVIKHFDIPNIAIPNIAIPNIVIADIMNIVSFTEFGIMDMAEIKKYKRVIVDEIHEMYAIQHIKDNGNIFNKLLECNHFMYRWGVSATPFVDSMAMFNIIKYLFGANDIYNPNIGNNIMIQNELKQVFHKNTKLNIEYELKLPEIEITNILLNFNKYEREIYNTELIGNENKDIQFLRQLCCDVLISVCDSIENIITVSELKKLTLNRFLERVITEKEHLDLLIQKKINVEIEYEKELALNGMYSQQCNSLEYINRIQHLDANINTQNIILKRRIDVYQSYKSMTENIEEIISNANTSNETVVETGTENGTENDLSLIRI
jgi:hypothetical protein